MVTINYTDEQTTNIVQAYRAGASIDDLVTQTGRSKKSLIAKLVKEGVYVKDVSAKSKSKTKTEMMQFISAVLDQDETGRLLTSLEKCTKEDLQVLADFFSKYSDMMDDISATVHDAVVLSPDSTVVDWSIPASYETHDTRDSKITVWDLPGITRT